MYAVVDPYQYVIHNTPALCTGVGGEGSEAREELCQLVHRHGADHHPRQPEASHLHGFIPDGRGRRDCSMTTDGSEKPLTECSVLC